MTSSRRLCDNNPAPLGYLVLFSGQKYQTYRDGFEGSVKQYFQWLQDIYSLFCFVHFFQNGRYLPDLVPCLG